MKPIAPILAVLALSACAMPPPEKGDVVPARALIAAQPKPVYECSNYDRLSETCETVTKIETRDSLWRAKGVAAYDFDGTLLRMEFTGRGRFRDTRLCADLGDVDITLPDFAGTDMGALFRAVLRAGFDGAGELCTSYFETSEPGVYREEASLPDGTPIAGEVTTIRYFQSAPKLRPMRP